MQLLKIPEHPLKLLSLGGNIENYQIGNSFTITEEGGNTRIDLNTGLFDIGKRITNLEAATILADADRYLESSRIQKVATLLTSSKYFISDVGEKHLEAFKKLRKRIDSFPQDDSSIDKKKTIRRLNKFILMVYFFSKREKCKDNQYKPLNDGFLKNMKQYVTACPDMVWYVVRRLSSEANYWSLLNQTYVAGIEELLNLAKVPKEKWIDEANKHHCQGFLNLLPDEFLENDQ